MKLKTGLALGVLLLCATAPFARADEKRDAKIKAEMVENYLLWEIALKNKDAERIISLESPDFTYILESGKVLSKSEADEGMRRSMKAIEKVHSARVEIKKFSIEPNRVVALTKLYMDAESIGPNGRRDRFQTVLITRNIWVEYDYVWMLKRVEFVDWKISSDDKN